MKFGAVIEFFLSELEKVVDGKRRIFVMEGNLNIPNAGVEDDALILLRVSRVYFTESLVEPLIFLLGGFLDVLLGLLGGVECFGEKTHFLGLSFGFLALGGFWSFRLGTARKKHKCQES